VGPPNLQAGQRIEVKPLVTLTAAGSACRSVSDVFDRATGRTSTYQSAELR
jgi:hypothetical protein